jgi:hypothetical protein
MSWNRRQARYTLLLFLLIFAAGQVKAYLVRPVYPDWYLKQGQRPPDGCLVDATAIEESALEAFSPGTTAAEAFKDLELAADPLGSGFCLPRASILYQGSDGWRVRTMTQRERWVRRIPMDLYHCEPEDLQRIKGIGPSLAEKVYQYVQERGTLSSLTELDNLPGVGPGKLKVLMRELEIP